MSITASLLMLGGSFPAAADTAQAGTGHISGTITAPAGSDLSRVIVIAQTSDYKGYGGSAVGADGKYSIENLPPGSYEVKFSTRDSGLVTEWHDDQVSPKFATKVGLSADQPSRNIDATLEIGSVIRGTVSLPHGAESSDIVVLAYNENAFPELASSARVATDGSYELVGMARGENYKLKFYDGVGARDAAIQWFGGGTVFSEGQTVSINDDVVVLGDVALERPAVISGTVKGLAEGEMPCIYAYQDQGRTIIPSTASVSVMRGSQNIQPAAAATANPCAETADTVASLPVINNSFSFDGLPPGSYRLYLDAPSRSGSSAGTSGAPQWVAEKVLKTAGMTVAVQEGDVVSNVTTTAFPSRTFSDVPRGMQFFEEISWLASTGISTGWTEASGVKTYRPVTPIARDAMAAFIYRLAGSPEFETPTVSPFSDVPTSNVYYKEIAWLASEGISTGWIEPGGTKTFRPLSPIARDAMAVFLYRFAGEPPHTPSAVSPFADVATNNVYYKQISWLASAGISTGWTETDGRRSFRFLSAVNRDAMAAFMDRYAKLVNTLP